LTRGFTLIETILTLTLTVCISGVVLNAIAQSTKLTKKIVQSQDRLEGIFHTVEMMKSDLLKCGMRLQEAASRYGFPLFAELDDGYQIVMGTDLDFTAAQVFAGTKTLPAFLGQIIAKGRKLLIYNLDQDACQWSESMSQDKSGITLKDRLSHDFKPSSLVIPTREIEYRYFRAQKVLKRRVDKGTFQPLLENVTDFSVKFNLANHSALYRIEIEKKEQVRGFIFLANTVDP